MAQRSEKKERAHPWRVCPPGKHWVAPHPRRVPKGVTPVDGHCRTNPSHKDQIYSGELEHISNLYFARLKDRPKADNLGFKHRGNLYDDLIAGWTMYWNKVLEPNELLDPNLVKALIATESGFDRKAAVFAGKKAGRARGL